MNFETGINQDVLVAFKIYNNYYNNFYTNMNPIFIITKDFVVTENVIKLFYPVITPHGNVFPTFFSIFCLEQFLLLIT